MKHFLVGLVLSTMAFTTWAQAPCPTSVSVTILSNTNDGHLVVSQNYAVSTASVVHNVYTLSNQWYTAYNHSYGYSGNAQFSNVPSGTYTLCVQDSTYIYGSGFCPVISDCMQVVVTNTVVAPSCQASFYTYTDSTTCVTHFMNTSIVGDSLSLPNSVSYSWFVDGVLYSQSKNHESQLANGNHYVILYTYSGGSLCDSVSQYITSSCSGDTIITPPSCQASFYTYTDSTTCLTHFVNTSTGTNGLCQWNIDGVLYPGIWNPVLSLSSGGHYAMLFNYSNGSLCDSLSQYITVSCSGDTIITPPVCQANAQFVVFSDSVNAGNYFVYHFSTGTGNVSYLWDFGDGTTSTQPYPFHQYDTPGQYILCLTVTATNGSLTCTDTQCDSSSVGRKVASGFLMNQIKVLSPVVSTEIKESEIFKTAKAFPNPMSDELTIEVELTETDAALSYTIVDAMGRIVIHNLLSNSKTSVNTSHLEKGLYFLTISNKNGNSVKTMKLIK